jgi:hypothetical protein
MMGQQQAHVGPDDPLAAWLTLYGLTWPILILKNDGSIGISRGEGAKGGRDLELGHRLGRLGQAAKGAGNAEDRRSNDGP